MRLAHGRTGFILYMRILSVAENQFVILGINNDRMFAIHLLCKYILRQAVEHHTLQNTFDRTGAKFRVIPLFCPFPDPIYDDNV